MKVVTALLTVVLLAQSAFAQEAVTWSEVAAAIPLGSRVRVNVLDGPRVTGTLMRVDANGVLIKKNTRRPEPAITISFDQMSKLERVKEGGFSIGKAIAVGAGAGAGAMLTLILFALQIDD